MEQTGANEIRPYRDEHREQILDDPANVKGKHEPVISWTWENGKVKIGQARDASEIMRGEAKGLRFDSKLYPNGSPYTSSTCSKTYIRIPPIALFRFLYSPTRDLHARALA